MKTFKTNMMLMLALLLGTVAYAQVGIGTTSPDASSVLELKSTTRGFLPPRMTTAQRDAISSPAEGLVIYNMDVKCLQWYDPNGWFDACSGATYGAITSLDCAGATNNGTLTDGQAAAGVDSEISYTGGNGQSHSGQTVASTGVTGLTATLSAGNFATGSGTLTYTITGTPASDGTASFAINIGGQSCSLTRTVNPSIPTVIGANGVVWMDRNLGASQVATSSTDDAAYGDLYQWGRAADGHQIRTSGTTSTNATTAVPNAGNPWDGLFITEGSSPYDWLTPQDNTLWQGVNGTNNPCPAGFRVPTEAELDAERVSWSSNNSAGAFDSPLKLPVAGYRIHNTGGLELVGSDGYYWTSNVSGTNARGLGFASTNALMYPQYRAVGYSVRCLKD